VVSGCQPNITIEKSLIVRINPSINQASKATIECSLYVPPGEANSLSIEPLIVLCVNVDNDSTGGRLWLGLVSIIWSIPIYYLLHLTVMYIVGNWFVEGVRYGSLLPGE